MVQGGVEFIKSNVLALSHLRATTLEGTRLRDGWLHNRQREIPPERLAYEFGPRAVLAVAALVKLLPHRRGKRDVGCFTGNCHVSQCSMV